MKMQSILKYWFITAIFTTALIPATIGHAQQPEMSIKKSNATGT